MIEAENGEVRIPLAVGGWEVKACVDGGEVAASSIALAVSEEGAFNRLLKGGLRLLGRRCVVEILEGIGPGLLRGSGATPRRTARARCTLCVERHCTGKHTCPAEGCTVCVCDQIAACGPNDHGSRGAVLTRTRRVLTSLSNVSAVRGLTWRGGVYVRREGKLGGTPRGGGHCLIRANSWPQILV